MKNLLALLFDPRGKITFPVFTLGIMLSILMLFLLSGVCLFGRMIPFLQGAPFHFVLLLVLACFSYQMAVLFKKRVYAVGFRSLWVWFVRRMINVFGWIAVLGILAGFLAVAWLLWQSFRMPEHLERDSRGLRVVECRSPFGSWFNMNVLSVKDTAFLYEKNGFLGTRKIRIPFSRARSVRMENGYFWNNISIVTGRLPLSEKEIYIIEDSIFQTVKTEIELQGPDLVVEERKSFLRMLFSGPQ